MTPGSDPHSQAADAVHEGRPVEAQYVRQGRRGTHVLWILVVSLIMVVAAFAVIFFGSSEGMNATTSDNNKTRGEAATFAAPEPAAKQTSSEDPSAPARGSTNSGQQPTAQPAETQSSQ